MLLSLPIELVERVIRLALPEHSMPRANSRRQDTLRSLCLVSSTLRQIVQPILDELVCIDRSDVWERFKRRPVSKAQTVRSLLVSKVNLDWSSLCLEVRKCSALQRLYVTDMNGSVNLANLEGLSSLNTLLFKRVRVSPTTFVLPCITELVYLHWDPAQAMVGSFITSAAFPSLRLLATDSSSVDPSIFPDLNAFLFIDQSDTPFPPLGNICPTRVLLPLPRKLTLAYTSVPRGPFPRYLSLQSTVKRKRLTDLTSAILALKPSDTHFHLLYLPIQCKPDHPSFANDEERAECLQKLYEACAARGVRVDWADAVRDLLHQFARHLSQAPAHEDAGRWA
ncbi:hypothetical protein JCM8097_004027 [Rhodosporidiobolus ruineniae]